MGLRLFMWPHLSRARAMPSEKEPPNQKLRMLEKYRRNREQSYLGGAGKGRSMATQQFLTRDVKTATFLSFLGYKFSPVKELNEWLFKFQDVEDIANPNGISEVVKEFEAGTATIANPQQLLVTFESFIWHTTKPGA